MILRPSRPFSSPWSRRKSSLIAALLTLFLVLLFLQTRMSYTTSETPSLANANADPVAGTAPSAVEKSLLESQARFWRSLYQIILNNDPTCKNPPDAVVPQKLDIGFDPTSEKQRPDILYMDTADISRMKGSHSNFVNDMKQVPPMPYNPTTRGIVMTGGYNQLPVLVISIRMLRRTGSELPVEVFVADKSEWDKQICNFLLPSLNAKCLLFSEIFEATGRAVSIDRYQYKIMAILFSSFEEVLLLDSDAYPIHNPLPLFDEEPFKSNGLIVWPDFWYPSESPYFFDIAKIDTIPKLTERASVESGELMYSKSKHHTSLMLAAYYNYYGPKYYYPLLSQGAPGQGDKETFAWAAVAMDKPFYAVHERVMALGRHDTNGNFLGSAMAQHDPIADYNLTQEYGPPNDRTKALDTGTDDHFEMRASAVKPFFIHANFPKFDPSTIFDYDMPDGNDNLIGGPTKDSNGTSVRCWMDPARAMELFGFDAERRFWEEIRATACDHERDFGTWKGSTGICARTQRYWDDVFGGTIS